MSRALSFPSAVLSAMAPLSPLVDGREHVGRSRVRRRDAGRDADPVVRGTAHREAGQLGDRAPDPGDPVEVPDGVLRQPAAPPRHDGVDRPRRDAGGGREVAQRDRGKILVVALQVDDLAMAPDGRAHDREATGRLTQPAPLVRRVRRRLDDLAVDRGYEETRTCLLYTSDAADEEDSVDLGGRRIIKK